MTQITFSRVAALWKAEKRKYIKASTYAHYIQHLNKHILPVFGDKADISDKDLQEYVYASLSEGLAPKTVKDSLIIVKMVHRYGAQLGLWPRIDYKVHFPTTAQERRTLALLTLSQQQRLARYLQDNFSFRNLGLLICMYSGLRVGEICALQWQDIDTIAGEIHIRKTVSRIWLSDGDERQYTLNIGAPKTVASVRDIPITRPLSGLLKPLKKMMNPQYYIVSNSAEPLEPRYYRDYFRRVLEKVGIPNIRFHALRHSFATRCIESKCDYKTLSVLLGHASITTTLDIYVHPGYSDKKKALDKMVKNIKL